jgi:hypothetical protein
VYAGYNDGGNEDDTICEELLYEGGKVLDLVEGKIQ